jgi:hypothetical protein
MGKASGVLLVLAGLSLTAYMALPTSKPPVSGNDDFDFRLSEPALSKSEPAPDRMPRAPASPTRASRPYVPPTSSIDGSQTALSAPAIVTVPPHNRQNLRLAVAPPPKAGGLATDRTQLARELQKELRRVGCYDGEIHGAWTTSSKRAMKTFTERVNASLPVEEPDQVLLSLLQGQPDKACGRPCPAGESAEGGRCVPSAVAASSRKAPQSTPTVSREATTSAIGLSATAATPPATSQPPGGRMSLSGPEDEDPQVSGLGGPPVAPAALPRPSAGYGAPMAEGRNASPVTTPSRRFDAQSFFRRIDKQSPN